MKNEKHLDFGGIVKESAGNTMNWLNETSSLFQNACKEQWEQSVNLYKQVMGASNFESLARLFSLPEELIKSNTWFLEKNAQTIAGIGKEYSEALRSVENREEKIMAVNKKMMEALTQSFQQQTEETKKLFEKFTENFKSRATDKEEFFRKVQQQFSSQLETSRESIRISIEFYSKNIKSSASTQKKLLEEVNDELNTLTETQRKCLSNMFAILAKNNS